MKTSGGNGDAKIEIRSGTAGESAFVGGTRVRVSDVVRLYRLMEKEVVVERIIRSLPNLTSAQVHAALEYWQAHREDVELEIKAEEELLERFQHID